MSASAQGAKRTLSQRWRSMSAREVRLAWLLILPTALIVFGVVLFPAIFSIWISFHDVGLKELGNVFQAEFVGLDNYRAVVNDFAFKFQGLQSWGAAVTSVVYSFLATFVTMVLGLVAALLLNRPFRARGLARAVFLFPYVAPIVSVAFVWSWILDPRPSGVLNDILMSLGLIELPKAYLAQRGLALFIVIMFTAWRYFPFAMLMILARLQAIDQTLYEAADVDGAGEWAKFWYITIPELRYVLGAIFLLRLIWTFNKFDDIWLLTGGGFGTNVLPVLTYQFSFRSNNFGMGAANAMILLMILVVFLVLYVGVVMRRVDEE
ncbi:MAG: sugar ABC transporter permease [Anaerolineae bacterium]